MENKLTPVQQLRNYLNNNNVKNRFEEVLKNKSAGFMASILGLANSNANIANCDPNSVVNSALIAATLDLPINPNLGFAYIIPYGNKAQFQIGYKGFLQLALRSGKIKNINVTEVYEGELIKADRFKGIYEFDESKKTSEKVIGYYAYIQTTMGLEKGEFWSIEKATEHGKKYSRSFNQSNGLWKNDPHAMGKKTVLKSLISKWTELSIEPQMQTAVIADQSVINDADNLNVEYVDAVDVSDQKAVTEDTKADVSQLFNNETTN